MKDGRFEILAIFWPFFDQISSRLFWRWNSQKSAAQIPETLCWADPRGQRALRPTKVCAKQQKITGDIASEKWRILNFGQIWAQNCNFHKVHRKTLDHFFENHSHSSPARAPGTAEPKKSAFLKWPSKNRPWVAFFRQAICKSSFSLPFPLFPL